MNKKILIGILIVLAVLIAGYLLIEVEEVEYTAEEAEEIAEEWVRQEAPTFTEREGENLTYVETNEVEEGVFEVVFDFQTRFAGYGVVEEDEMAAQVLVDHVIVITVDSNEVVKAVTDGVFDEVSGEMIEEEEVDETAEVGLYFIEVVDGTEEVVSVTREIEIINGIEGSAIVALLEGVTDQEEEDGLSSAIPGGARLLSSKLENGIFRANFNAEIDPGGGSAWISAIQDQITYTLTQFDSVDGVIILVEGEEDVLQP